MPEQPQPATQTRTQHTPGPRTYGLDPTLAHHVFLAATIAYADQLHLTRELMAEGYCRMAMGLRAPGRQWTDPIDAVLASPMFLTSR